MTMITNEYKSACGMHTDTYFTGKTYDKLDCYMQLQRQESEGALLYICSSNQFKTQRRFKQWIKEYKSFASDVKLIVRKDGAS